MAWESQTIKRVPTALREACIDRDGHRCLAKLASGERCKETTKLEADHIKPDHLGGPTILENLQTLCIWHHKRKTQAESAAARRKNPVPPQRYPKERSPGLL